MNSFNTLKVASINASGLTVTTKREAIASWCILEDMDICITVETHFAEGREPPAMIEGYRSFYNSCTPNGSFNSNHKWGVAIHLKSALKICDVIRPKRILDGRILMISIFLESVLDPKPLWIVGMYAPVRTYEHQSFFHELIKMWNTHLKENAQAIIAGDLNARM